MLLTTVLHYLSEWMCLASELLVWWPEFSSRPTFFLLQNSYCYVRCRLLCLFFKKIFFTWTIFKVFVEFVTIFLRLFCFLATRQVGSWADVDRASIKAECCSRTADSHPALLPPCISILIMHMELLSAALTFFKQGGRCRRFSMLVTNNNSVFSSIISKSHRNHQSALASLFVVTHFVS